MELNALLAAPAVLPSLPRVVALLIAELARDEPNLRCVNQLVGADPALAARVLACANGPEFESHRQIAGIPEALALLGTLQLRELVGSAPLGTTSRSVPGMNLQHFWRCSLNTAKLARSLAGRSREKLVRHSDFDQTPLVHEPHPVRDLPGKIHFVCDTHHCHAIARQ